MARSFNFVEEFNRNNFNLKKYVYEKRAEGQSDRQIATSLGIGMGKLKVMLNEITAPVEAAPEPVKEEPRVTVVDKEKKQTKVTNKKEPYVPVEMKIEEKKPETLEID